MARRERWIRRNVADPPGAEPDPSASQEASIAPGCELEGELQLASPLTVYGDMKGAIDCDETVTVAEGGSVQGPIRARSVEVRGSVVGDLHARREVVLHAGGRLRGDVHSASLVVERGARFEGRSHPQEPIARRPPLDAETAAAPEG